MKKLLFILPCLFFTATSFTPTIQAHEDCFDLCGEFADEHTDLSYAEQFEYFSVCYESICGYSN